MKTISPQRHREHRDLYFFPYPKTDMEKEFLCELRDSVVKIYAFFSVAKYIVGVNAA